MEKRKQPNLNKKIETGQLAPALPVVMGYLPIGFAYGVLAANAGLSVLQTVVMSVIVFAGSAQLMAVGFFAQGLHPFSIIAATFIINLRHLLMSASLSPFMSKWNKAEVAGFCYELTDETFAVHSLRFERGETAPRIAIGINLVCQAAWVAGSLLGVLAGGLIGDVRVFALDYALPAMFIALLILQIRGKLYILAALAGGAASLLIWGAGLTQWNVILATLIGATLGAGVETWQKRRS
jgi:4-azaleucine resistance transporter AzlC